MVMSVPRSCPSTGDAGDNDDDFTEEVKEAEAVAEALKKGVLASGQDHFYRKRVQWRKQTLALMISRQTRLLVRKNSPMMMEVINGTMVLGC